MIQKFNELPWHDAELKEIIVDRTNKDNIQILIRWPEEYGALCVYIEFYDCYAFQADMHFGVISPDYILDAECIQQSEELDNIKKIWGKMGVDISKLNCYRIETNSTNSIISIYALGLQITNVNKNDVLDT